MASPLVSATWLRQQLLNGLKNIRILDASWHMNPSRSAKNEFMSARIQGAQFFDIDAVSDNTSDLPDMLPSTRDFGNYVGGLGVGNDNHVVIYDNNEETGLFSAPRAWWMFRVFGHREISILDGGLPWWRYRGFSLDQTLPSAVTPREFKAVLNTEFVRNFQQIYDNISSKEEQVVDARSEGRFSGTAPEPRPSLPSGHMTNSINLPFKNLLNPENKLLKSKQHLQEVFDEAGIDMERPLVASCGSGITACIVAFAAHMLGKDVPVYDGSWTEWVQKAPDNTMEKGVKAEDM